MLGRLRISTSLYLLLMMFCVMQIISSGLSLGIIHADQSYIEQIDLGTQKRDTLGLSWAALLQSRNTLNRIAVGKTLQQSEDHIGSMVANVKETLDRAEMHFAEFIALPKLNDEDGSSVLLASVETSYKEYINALRELSAFLESGNYDAFLDQPTEKYQQQLESDFNHYMQYIGEVITTAVQDGRLYYQISVAMFVGAILMVLVVAWAAHWWLKKNLLRPFANMRSHFQNVAEGKLNKEVSVFTQDEIGEVFLKLREMQRSLVNSITLVKENTNLMYNGIQEITQGNTDLSSRTEEQAASLEETAASMEQLTATVRQNAENARQASELAVSASKTASKGGELTVDVVETMDAIANSSQKISAIISVIDGIAFQTNILALNAAVEAARAGEQGRGFSVVAGEVRDLAQRSAEAAKEIKTLISESVQRVSQGSELVSHAGKTMNELVVSVNQVTDLMAEIAAASDEQSRGIHQVAQAVTQMDQVTQQNAALVEQSAAAAAALEDQADILVQIVAQFELPNNSENKLENELSLTLRSADSEGAVNQTH
ncbi:HAMP domain-containing protein [Photorhabdus laumondii subsp. laumondii]|uniref:Photorhabdus luminescens subsp. laumondii TTO1 complete genome segment 7/17 n=2 Tax=Photorhabdus laumondii subsp. laumondii TaxID=141679 RepID=Q7N5T3_PHOLL|nr:MULTISPECIES: methyl-accepting chemotaxis protein [Photorhabdus]AXG46991.1 methyl-accepting chemotaxis protein [Photorhabdus laumondii subsp. laumondii]MCC8385778.1 Tar ligand binding domain-containing protein [Photorhabdus laumondii]MCC8414744.1 Tar ligand binding domain-containing protein [Photorhabdus laumondii]NDK96915.1 HAMP domain-containing protein [Photorhabdus laumondii subsp. laumondii]NDL23114.1 HAMP domain-containing protein [Photorhabdus laumondii subsp. laumondii]